MSHYSPNHIRILSIKRISFSIFLFVFTLILLYLNLEKTYDKKLERIKINSSELYIDNILNVEDKILKGKSIFFLDTTRMKNPQKNRELTLRQACSIESAALSNPNTKIFVILVSPYRLLNEIKITSIMRAILNYSNVYVNSMNLMQFSIDAHNADFIRDGSLFKSKFIKQHTSDFLRLLILKKYGGIYIDTDMIVKENLKHLPKNFICRDHGFLNGAIMRMDNSNEGKHFANLFLNEITRSFNGSEWGWNGPLLLFRVLNGLCKTDDVNEMHDCVGFKVLDEKFCYPISGLKWHKLFDEIYTEDVLESIKQSYVVHFWNKLSQVKKLKCNSKAAYLKLAKKYCPKTFQLCTDFF